MTILYRGEYIGEPNKFDIAIARKPLGTLPGDFMLMQVITLNEREQIPVVPGWTIVLHDYQPGISQFVFYKISDDNGDKFNIIRKKTGTNYVRVYSWYSDKQNEITLDQSSVLVPNTFKQRRNRKLSVNSFIMQHENNNIRLVNADASVIMLSLGEHEQVYQPKLVAPVITEVNLNDDNSVTLKWNGIERYKLEMFKDGDTWVEVNQDLLDDTTYTVNDLLPSTKYNFRVTAIKDNIVSQSSNIISIRTKDKIALRSVSKGTSSVQNPRIIVSPPNVQKGDLMIMQVSYMSRMKITKVSQGWKLLHEYRNSEVSSSIYYKIASKKEPASYFVQHNGAKTKKLLVAIAAFYSPTGHPVRIENSAIQFNPESNYITFPPVSLEADYSLGIALSVRNLESSLRLPIDSTIMWDSDKNLRTTGIFQGYTNPTVITPEAIYANPGVSVSATIALVEKEIVDVPPPPKPTGLRAKRAEGTVIRLS